MCRTTCVQLFLHAKSVMKDLEVDRPVLEIVASLFVIARLHPTILVVQTDLKNVFASVSDALTLHTGLFCPAPVTSFSDCLCVAATACSFLHSSAP